MEKNTLGKNFNTLTLIKFAVPNIILMVFLSLYTIADGMFVSRLVGTLELSSINMSWPLSAVELGISIMLSSGGSAVVAKKMGEGKQDEARKNFSCLIWVTLITGIGVNLICLIFLKPLLHILGTSSLQMPSCTEYTKLILIFSPAMFMQNLFGAFIIAEGKPGLGLGVTVFGGVSNMFLDWLFMGPMKMGIKGAAIATGIGYIIPALFGFIYFALNRKGSLYIVKCSFYGRMILKSCTNGASEMVTNTANAVTTFLFNIIFMKFYAEDGVAAITIIMYFQFVYSSVFYGFSAGTAPVISYKYGADDRIQLKTIIKICLKFTVFASLIMYGISMLTIDTLMGVFTLRDGNVFNIAVGGFPLYAISFLLMGISIFASSMFTAFSDGKTSALISFARTFVFLVGSILILPRVFGEKGIWLAVPVAEALGLIISAFCLIRGRKKYHY